MSKLKLHIILVLALWLVFCGMAAAEQLYVNEGGWWREDGAFNASTAPIQAAVGAAGEGDAIYVEGGDYNENVNVDKPRLTLEGGGADVVTVTAASSVDHVFEVTADYVDISGFAVRGATDSYIAGIYLSNADYCNISENNVYGNYRGIYLSSSSNNTLTNNNANANNGVGIGMGSSSNNTLTNNTANLNGNGIYMDHSSNYNTLESNTANSNNNVGVGMDHSNNNTLENNTANSNDWGGICLWRSSNNTLTNNNANSNGHGIHFYDTDNNNIACNRAQNNTQYGFHLYNADNNNIAYNLVQNNTKRGFYIHSGSTGNNVSYNNIIENGNYTSHRHNLSFFKSLKP